MKKTVFHFSSYKSFLSHHCSQSPRGEASRLAEALHCQKSYLSQVLRGKPQLTNDHIYLAVQYLQMTALEGEYFSLLVEKEKASVPEYRKHIEKTLGSLRDENERLSNVVARAEVKKSETDDFYYAHWSISAIHFLLATSKSMTVRKIARSLHLSEAAVIRALNHLKSKELVKEAGGAWSFLKTQPHLPSESAFYPWWHQNWRQQATGSAYEASKKNLHFTGVQAISIRDFEKIKAYLREALQEVHKVANPSASEVLVNLNLDFWQVSTGESAE